MGWKFYSLIRMIFPPIRSSAISSTGCSNKRNGEMLGENFRISTSSCAESCTSRGAKGKGAVDNIEETRGWRWSETLGGHTVNRVSSSSSSSSRVLAGNDTLSRKSRGWNERASLSASNCDRVVVEEIVDPFTIRSPEKMFSWRAWKKRKKKKKGEEGNWNGRVKWGEGRFEVEA